jgi:hypothetical protein
VTPRLTLTTRPGRRAASCFISAEPMHPVPPVTSTFAPRSQSASFSSGKHSPRWPMARNRARSAMSPAVDSISD